MTMKISAMIASENNVPTEITADGDCIRIQQGAYLVYLYKNDIADFLTSVTVVAKNMDIIGD
jgi:hypothetical protein